MAIYVSSYGNDHNALNSALTNTTDRNVVVDIDIDLNNLTVTATDETVIIFEHGKLSNGKLSGEKIRILSDRRQIFHNIDLTDLSYNKEVYPEWFGVKADGITDDTSALQYCINSVNNRTLVSLCGEGVHVLNGIIEIKKTITLTNGILRFDSGFIFDNVDIDGNERGAITIKKDGIHTKLINVTLENPNLLHTESGPKSYGILIGADNVTIEGCNIIDFETGICVFIHGEWQKTMVTNNYVRAIGIGEIEYNLATGEDRGFGITTWGCQAIISNNIVECKNGYDCGIGILALAMDAPEFLGTNIPSTGTSEDLVVISNNVVVGKFRRSIEVESMNYVNVSDNVVEGATWYGIGLIYGNNYNCNGNIIKMTRSINDLQGGLWLPPYSGITLRAPGSNHNITNNNISVTGHADFGICHLITNGHGNNLSFTGNKITVEDGGFCKNGIYLYMCKEIVIKDNFISGVSEKMIYVSDISNLNIEGNRLKGNPEQSPLPAGIFQNNNPSETLFTIIKNNVVSDLDTAFELSNGTFYISGNMVQNSNIGFNCWNFNNSFVFGNNFSNVTTNIQYLSHDNGNVYYLNGVDDILTPIEKEWVYNDPLVIDNLVSAVGSFSKIGKQVGLSGLFSFDAIEVWSDISLPYAPDYSAIIQCSNLTFELTGGSTLAKVKSTTGGPEGFQINYKTS